MTDNTRALLEQALETIVELEYSNCTAVSDKKARDAKSAIRAELAKPVEQAEPVAWMWQHEETGRTGFVEARLAKDWTKLNPRLPLVTPVYSHPPTPAWHDAPTEPGLWLCNDGDDNPYRRTTHRVTFPLNQLLVGEDERWFGPIPQDKEGGAT